MGRSVDSVTYSELYDAFLRAKVGEIFAYTYSTPMKKTSETTAWNLNGMRIPDYGGWNPLTYWRRGVELGLSCEGTRIAYPDVELEEYTWK